MRSLARLVIPATMTAVVAAAPAPAAMTIGSDLSAPPHSGNNCSNQSGDEYACTWMSPTIPGRTTAAPSDGVVTRWRIATAAGSEPQTVRLRIIRPGASGAFAGAGTGPEETLPTTGGVAVFPVRLPIAAGDHVGIDQQQGVNARFAAVKAGAVLRNFNPFVAEGATTTTSTAFADDELLVNADIEPDGDTDGFGDESQDACPGTAGPDGGCPGPAPQPTPTPTATASPTATATPQPTPPPTEGVAAIPGTCVHPVTGTDGADTLTGSAFADVMEGLDGDDVLDGLGGRDCLFGDVSRPLSTPPRPASRPDGNDSLTGGDGRDLLVGGNQSDALRGGKGPDRLVGETGADRLAGGAAGDRLSGGRGGDRLIGGAGGDRLIGGAGDDVLRGGAGVNRYEAGPGDDRVIADNAVRERIDCGAGKQDHARIDRGRDTAVGCESVTRVP